MDAGEIVLTEDAASETCDLLLQHLLHWQGLRQECRNQCLKRWKLRPKHHTLEKIMLFTKATRLNPRCFSTFQDESYLGKIKKIGTHCHSVSVMQRIFQRLILNWSQRWWETKQHANAAELQTVSWKNWKVACCFHGAMLIHACYGMFFRKTRGAVTTKKKPKKLGPSESWTTVFQTTLF